MLKECASNKVFSGGESVCFLLPSFVYFFNPFFVKRQA